MKPFSHNLWVLSLLVACAAVSCDREDDTGSAVDRASRAKERTGRSLYKQATMTFQDNEQDLLLFQHVKRHAPPEQVMALSGVAPGMVVADIGCGIGYFTTRLAAAVGPQGTVYALDIEDRAIGHVRSRLNDEVFNPYDNIEAKVNTSDSTLLPPEVLDLGFMAHMGWHMRQVLLAENVRMLESTYQAIKPGGHMAVLQYLNPGGSVEAIREHFQSVGFVEDQAVEIPGENTWFILFHRPELAADAVPEAGQ